MPATTIRSIPTGLAGAAALAFALLALTACGGGEGQAGGSTDVPDGVYVLESNAPGTLAQLTIDGDQVAFDEIDCDGEPRELSSRTGVLDDGTVTWEDDDSTTTLEVDESGALIRSADSTNMFYPEGAPELRETLAEHESYCARDEPEGEVNLAPTTRTPTSTPAPRRRPSPRSSSTARR